MKTILAAAFVSVLLLGSASSAFADPGFDPGHSGPGYGGPGHGGHGGPGHGGPGHGGPGWGGPGHGPGPLPPPPPPMYDNLCQGSYYGSYNNGVRAEFRLYGYQLAVILNGAYVYSGTVNCRQYGNQAEIWYHLTSPVSIYGQGSISQSRDGRSYIQVNQDNGVGFSGVR